MARPTPKQREQRERFQIDAGHQYRIKRAIEPRPVTSIWQEPLENRDPEYGGDVDRHDPEQGDASHHVDRGNTIGRRYRASTGGYIWLELDPYRLHVCHLIFRADVRVRAPHNKRQGASVQSQPSTLSSMTEGPIGPRDAREVEERQRPPRGRRSLSY